MCVKVVFGGSLVVEPCFLCICLLSGLYNLLFLFFFLSISKKWRVGFVYVGLRLLSVENRGEEGF